jgi:excisionase family DNA binding protein
MQQNHTDLRSIAPNANYSVRELARTLKCGRGHLYREIEAGRLRAAKLNDRGDYRLLGAWVIEYLESRANESTVTA